jgi:transcriptional regulator with XRE-family HTH domain
VSAEAFGALLDQYRKQARLSMNALARSVAVDPSYISRVCRGEREPPRRAMVARLADALGVQGTERVRFFASAGYWPDAWPEDLPLQLAAERASVRQALALLDRHLAGLATAASAPLPDGTA